MTHVKFLVFTISQSIADEALLISISQPVIGTILEEKIKLGVPEKMRVRWRGPKG